MKNLLVFSLVTRHLPEFQLLGISLDVDIVHLDSIKIWLISDSLNKYNLMIVTFNVVVTAGLNKHLVHLNIFKEDSLIDFYCILPIPIPFMINSCINVLFFVMLALFRYLPNWLKNPYQFVFKKLWVSFSLRSYKIFQCISISKLP